MDDSAIDGQLKNESLCKVCGDKASGKHYGVASCDGCRGFFKRSIRRNLEYVCKENGKCIVDITRRNQCQACRFKKCLQVNMKREAVQHERAPRSVQGNFHPHHHYGLNFSSTAKVRGIHGTNFFSPPLQIHPHTIFEAGTGPGPGPGPGSSSALPLIPGTPYFQQGLVIPYIFNGIPKHSPFMSPLDSTNIPYFTNYFHQESSHVSYGSISSSRQNNVIDLKDDEVTSSEEATSEMADNSFEKIGSSGSTPKSFLEIATIEGNPTHPTIGLMRNVQSSPMSLFPVENIYESAAKLLLLALKWAKTIPSFLQLSCRDQWILLEESWSELFILTAAQWGFPVDEDALVKNAIASIPKLSTSDSKRVVLKENAHRLRDVINRLNLLRVDHTEHACLKALVLFKSECHNLCEPIHVELLQDQTHMMLHEYCVQKTGAHKGRFGKLLLSLPAIKAVSREILEELLFGKTGDNDGAGAVNRILREIAKPPGALLPTTSSTSAMSTTMSVPQPPLPHQLMAPTPTTTSHQDN